MVLTYRRVFMDNPQSHHGEIMEGMDTIDKIRIFGTEGVSRILPGPQSAVGSRGFPFRDRGAYHEIEST